jgi:L-lactate dehydrogenase
MKISIIGGAGRVGATAAFALQVAGVGREIALIDVARDQAEGEALDLRHGASLAASQVITAGDYAAAEGSDVVVITAGLRRRPDESRLDLINRNVALFRQILKDVSACRLASDAIIFVVANPVDVLTYLACKEASYPADRVIGLGTVLDTARFRSFLGEHFQLNPLQVEALILGEHGDSMVPIWSSATVNGIPLRSLPGYSEEAMAGVFAQTQKSGADVIRLKGGAAYAVALSILEVVRAIDGDTRAVLPVSTLQAGALGVSDVCLSLPTIIGKAGVVQVVEPAVAEAEREALRHSAQVLQQTIANVSSA